MEVEAAFPDCHDRATGPGRAGRADVVRSFGRVPWMPADGGEDTGELCGEANGVPARFQVRSDCDDPGDSGEVSALDHLPRSGANSGKSRWAWVSSGETMVALDHPCPIGDADPGGTRVGRRARASDSTSGRASVASSGHVFRSSLGHPHA